MCRSAGDGRWYGLIFAVALFGVVGTSRTQSVGSDQLPSIFNSLPADQQQRLLQQIGGGSSGGNGSGVGTARNNSAAVSARDKAARNGNAAPGQAAESLEETLRLHALDVVLIDIDVLRDRVVTTYAQLPAVEGVAAPAGTMPAGAAGASAATSATIPAPVLMVDQQHARDELIALLRKGDPYALDDQGLPSLRIRRLTDSGRLGVIPRPRTSPPGSGTATAIVSAWTSNPTNRTLFMAGSHLYAVLRRGSSQSTA